MMKSHILVLALVFSVIWSHCVCDPLPGSKSEVKLKPSDCITSPLENDLTYDELRNKILPNHRMTRNSQTSDDKGDIGSFNTLLLLLKGKITDIENATENIKARMEKYEKIRNKQKSNVTTEITKINKNFLKFDLNAEELHSNISSILGTIQDTEIEIRELKKYFSNLGMEYESIIKLNNSLMEQKLKISDLTANIGQVNDYNKQVTLQHESLRNKAVKLENKIDKIELYVKNMTIEMNLTKEKQEKLKEKFHGNDRSLESLKNNITEILDNKGMTEVVGKHGSNRYKRNTQDYEVKYQELADGLKESYDDLYKLRDDIELIKNTQIGFEKNNEENNVYQRKEIHELKTNIYKIETRIENCFSLIKILTTHLQINGLEIKSLKNESEMKNVNKNNFDKLNNDINKVNSGISQLNLNTSKLKTNYEDMRVDYDNIKMKNEELENKVILLEEKFIHFTNEIEDMNRIYKELREKNYEKDKELEQLHYNFTEIQQRQISSLSKLEEKIISLENENKEQAEIIEDLNSNLTLQEAVSKRVLINGLSSQMIEDIKSGYFEKSVQLMRRHLNQSTLAYKQLNNISVRKYDDYPLKAAERGYVELIHVMLDNGLPINNKYIFKNTMLHYAANYEHYNLVKFLIERGADVNVSDGLGYTPLHLATWEDNVNIVHLLVENGADINTQDYKGNTPLHWAAYRGFKSIAQYFVKEGCNTTITDITGKKAADVAKTPEIRAIINRK